MEKIMTNGFCELNEQEMMAVEGGESGAEAASKGFLYYTGWYWGNKIDLIIHNVPEDGEGKGVIPDANYHDWATNSWGQP